jgi:hypothetical protein
MKTWSTARSYADKLNVWPMAKGYAEKRNGYATQQ